LTKDGRDTKNIRRRLTQARKNIRCTKCDMVVKGRNKKPEKDDL